MRDILIELKRHAPYTALGTLSGVMLMVLLVVFRVPSGISERLFWFLHPLHVLLSAFVTAAMYRLHSRGGIALTFIIGYFGSIGVATLSDSIIPYLGEWMLQLPNRGWHFGFIEKWWLVNPLALLGITLACIRPRTRLPHAGHVWLSTWASLFHMAMAAEIQLSLLTMAGISVFLFLAVLAPCCASDIVFPLLFTRKNTSGRNPANI